jgi:hypothetical protein
MPKISKAMGATAVGIEPGPKGPVFIRGNRIVITDGAIGFAPSANALPDLWLTRDPTTGLLSGIGQASNSWEFDVTDYGAVGDAISDDTQAFRDAVVAAVAYARTTDARLAVVTGPPLVYKVSSATTMGGITLGNAVIPIPIVPDTERKVTLVFDFGPSAAANPHFNQTLGNRVGGMLLCTLTGQSVDGAWGVPSVIGGPAVSGSSATYGSSSPKYNNVHVVIQGLGISVPLDPTIMALDFGGQATVEIRDFSATADARPSTLFSSAPTHDWSVGVRFPQDFNNDNIVFGSLSIYGFYYGTSIGEHTFGGRLQTIYCNTGLFIQANHANIHGSSIQEYSCEACSVGIATNADGANGAAINIASMSCEVVTTHVVDPNSGLSGRIELSNMTAKTPTVATGHALNLELIASRQPRGIVGPPSVPASTTDLRNPYWRHAAVSIIGGTLTAIKIDGTTVASATGTTVMVPSGHSISVTYSVAPTWVWTLL